MKFKAIRPPDETPRRRSPFLKQTRPTRPEGNAYAPGMIVFTQDFKFALDGYRVSSFMLFKLLEFDGIRCLLYSITVLIPHDIIYQETAMPLYAVSLIEAALHPLGIISQSSCGLMQFLDAIFDFERFMEYRIGVVRTIEAEVSGKQSFFFFQLMNERGVENWVRLGIRATIG